MSNDIEEKLLLEKFQAYIRLMRIDKPIGFLLLLWPTLWTLWLAGKTMPPYQVIVIFVFGVFSMRTAGCVINDFIDRKIDGYVKRTKMRPLVSGMVTEKEAKILFVSLILFSLILVFTMNALTVWLSFAGLILTWIYPFMKRYTYLPQVVLGITFSWSVLMGWAAIRNDVSLDGWLLFFANICWTIVYDTQYAMVDRNDDLKIGVKSTAILFGRYDRLIIGLLQFSMLLLLTLVGLHAELNGTFYCCLFIVSVLFMYQQKLISKRQRESYFQAFLNNNYVGMAIFIGIVLNMPPISQC